MAVVIAIVFAGQTHANEASDWLGPPKTHIIQNDDGGVVHERLGLYLQMAERGDKFVIDGDCVSACTFLLFTNPKENVCVTPNARLGFHSAFFVFPPGVVVPAIATTRFIWNSYPKAVTALLKKKGWSGPDQPQYDLVYIEGAELRTLIQPCVLLVGGEV